METYELNAPDSDAIQQLNSVRYLYLRDIFEYDKRAFNTIRILVEEAVMDQTALPTGVFDERPELAALKNDSHPILSIEGCRTFQLSWKNYLAYLVTEEGVGSGAPKRYEDEIYTGRILRVYSKSHFLDHVMRDTGGHIHDVLHYKIVCLDHLIDVASYYPPVVEIVSPQAETSRIQ